MKKALIILFILCFSFTLFGQQKQGLEPFVIKGQVMINDIPEFAKISDKVQIDYTDQYDQIHSDSTHFDENGIFYIETDNIVKPVRISLIFDFDTFHNILAAPGYELTFYKPTKNKNDFRLTGKGSKASNYYQILDSIPASRYYAINWWDLNERDFIRRINETQRLRDSVTHLIFDQNAYQDRYLAEFGKITRMDNKFEKLKYLFLYAEHKKYSLEETIAFVRNNFDKDFFTHLSNEEYLISTEFRAGVSSHWPDAFLNYLLLSDHPTDAPTAIDKMPESSLLEKANTIFTGEVRAFVLYKIIAFPIWNFKTIDDLNRYRNQFKDYYTSFSAGAMNALENAFAEKTRRLAVEERAVTQKELEKTYAALGKPAPPFTLNAKNDKTYKLGDFKGKVVVLDLWSSWCDLCRIENQGLRKLYRKYRGDKRVAFIGIAVMDNMEEWISALKADRPVGIQLFDKDKVVYDAYIDEHIPKFVVIDKKGNVVNFMAPKPSSGNDLEYIIKQEIEK